MADSTMDLKAEQEATLARPPRAYGPLAKALFFGMDALYGKKMTLKKLKILELLARIPYQAWEVHYYRAMNNRFDRAGTVSEAEDIIQWGREAQDNEFWHLQVVQDKIRIDGERVDWLHGEFLPRAAAVVYNIVSRMLAFLSIRTAYQLNADFEDHAEHEYMGFVRDNPALDDQPVESEVTQKYGPFACWGDVFRRIALDERDHMNNSLKRCGRADEVVPYAGPANA